MKVRWSPLAVGRVSKIASYIRRENPGAAELWIHEIFDRVNQLERFPNSGRRLRETKRPDLRELVWGNYRIIYRREPQHVSILTVRHSKQILPLKELRHGLR